MGRGADRKGSGKWARTENERRKQIPLAIYGEGIGER